jgi:transglutaminase-like putative cysteine protease
VVGGQGRFSGVAAGEPSPRSPAQKSKTVSTEAVMVGLGKGFAPSASAANAALGGTVRQDLHPPGVEGTRYSLEEMARLIRDGRNDPRIRAWAGRTLMAAGKPTTVTAQAQALLDELRRKTIYVQDPVNTELMAKPHVTLCLDEHGLCMPAADCDDRVVAFASATMSIGLETMVVGQSYGTEQATHVIAAVYDPHSGWLKVDPSAERYRVGQSYPATKEWWMDPITGSIGSSATAEPHTLGKEPARGDFIGVGAIPFAHAFALDDGPGQRPADVPPGMGVIPFAHPFALDEGPGQRPAYIPPGFGQLNQTTTTPTPAAVATGTPTSDTISYVTRQLELAVHELELARNDLGAALQIITRTRSDIRGQDSIFDAEPTNFTVTSVADFPTDGQTWTQSMDVICNQLYDLADRMVGFGYDALQGNRQTYVDSSTNGIFIQSQTSDPWSLHAVIQSGESLILGFFDSAGNLLSGLNGVTGESLSSSQVQSQAGQTQTSAGTSLAPVVVIAAVAGIAVVAVATYYTVKLLVEKAIAVARQTTQQDIVKCIQAGNCPTGMLHENMQDELAAKKAAAADNPLRDQLEQAKGAFMWMAIGGIALSAIVVLGPIGWEKVLSRR